MEFFTFEWVTDPAVWERILRDMWTDAAAAGLNAHRVIRSPVRGGDGNVEFLVDLRAREPGDIAEYLRSAAGAIGEV